MTHHKERKGMKIKISRPHAISLQLYVKVVSKDLSELGTKRPVAFILPGGPGADHTAYLKYTCLKEVADLVFHDPIGCGQSDKDHSSAYTMNHYIDDVEAIRKQLSLNKIIVIGKSYGSICALGYALRYPHAILKLVLAAGAPSHHFLDTAKKNLLQRGTPEQIKICEKLWAGCFTSSDDLLDYFKTMNTLYSVKARTLPEEFNLIQKSRRFSFEPLNEGFRQSFWYFNFEKELKDLTCPTLILAGREDWINDAKYAEFMAKHIPHSQIKIFEGASHAMESDVTEEYFQTISDFIEGHKGVMRRS